jgi:uncharacterized protein (AIM24 family)
MQFVEIELDPGRKRRRRSRIALMYKESVVQMETVFGDGSHSGQGGGFMDKLLGAGKRIITGEVCSPRVLARRQQRQGQGRVRGAVSGHHHSAAPDQLQRRIICQKDSFLCAARGVSIGIFFQKKVMTALFGGEGFIMQKLEGDGRSSCTPAAPSSNANSRPGERLDVDTGCVVALTDTVGFDVKPVGGIKSMLFGGEGVFLATLTGPGHVWLQSLPFSRMAGRMFAAAYQKGGSKDEGSVLGGLGNILSGDRGF